MDAIIEGVKPILNKHKIAFMQVVTTQGVNTILLHESGEMIESGFLLIQHEVTKGLSAAQAAGVAITDSKRYQLGAMLGVSTEEDTDGQYGSNEHLENPEPVQLGEDTRPWMTEAQFNTALKRINSGELEVLAECKKHYRMKMAYSNTLKQAYDNFGPQN